MRWNVTWWWVLSGFATLAFLVGAIGANASILWLKYLDPRCLEAEPLIFKFLQGFNYFALAANILGIILAVSALIWNKNKLSLANLGWLLKDFVAGLTIAAIIATLLALWDVKKERQEGAEFASASCSSPSSARVVVALNVTALILFFLYILFRVVMVLTNSGSGSVGISYATPATPSSQPS